MTGEFESVDDGEGRVLASTAENAVAFVHEDDEGRRTVGYLAGDGSEVEESFVAGPNREAVVDRLGARPEAWTPEELDDPAAVMDPDFDLGATADRLAVREGDTVGVRDGDAVRVAGPAVDAVAERLGARPTAWTTDELDDPFSLAEDPALFGRDEVTAAAFAHRDPERGTETLGYLRARDRGEPQSFVVGPALAETTAAMGVDRVMHWAPSSLDDLAVVMDDGMGLEMMTDLDASAHADGLLLPRDPGGDGLTPVQRTFAAEVGFDPDGAAPLPDGGFSAEGPADGVCTVAAGDFVGNHHVEFRSPPRPDQTDDPGAATADSVSADLRLGEETVSYVGWGSAAFVAARHEAEGVDPLTTRGNGADGDDRAARLYGPDAGDGPSIVERPGSELSGADDDDGLVDRVKREAAANREDDAEAADRGDESQSQ